MKPKTVPKDPSRPVQLEMYYYLRLTRAIDEKSHHLHQQGKVVGGLFSNLGQEAISVGTAFALEKGDYLAPMTRNIGAVLVRGHTAREILSQYLARATSPTGGKDNSQHFGDVERTGVVGYISMLGDMVPVMAGMALGSRLKGEARVALTYVGDGGSSTGDFYEGLNFAAVQNAPLVVIIENNLYAYSTPVSRQSRLKDLSEKAKAFGIPGASGDGNDVLEVYRMTKACVEEARAGAGPQLLEFRTFRMRGHAPHDNQAYVPKDLIEEWKRKDPIERFEKTLGLSEGEKAGIVGKVQAVIDDAAEYAEKSPFPDGAEAVRGVFEDDSIVRRTPWWRRDA